MSRIVGMISDDIDLGILINDTDVLTFKHYSDNNLLCI